MKLNKNQTSLLNFLINKTVTLDCNILLLFIIGGIEKRHIKKFKRTYKFSDQDFDMLLLLVKNSKIIISSNIFTEASNLLESYTVQTEKIGLQALKFLLQKMEEKYVPSGTLSIIPSFLKFGLADSSIDNLCQSGVVPITTDLNLYGYLSSKKLTVINFYHFISDSYLYR